MDLQQLDAAQELTRAPYEPPHVPAGSSKGGQFGTTSGSMGEHSGFRPGDQPRTSTGTKPTSKPTPRTTPLKPAPGPLHRGAKGKQVRQLQALLGVLGFDPGGVDGIYGPKTEAAVKAAQKRLGLKQTGRADGALLKTLADAQALSPCVQRSADDDFDLLRAALGRGDFDENHVLDNGICRTCKEGE